MNLINQGAQSAQNPTQEQLNSAALELGIPTVGNALTAMWQRSRDNLTTEELQWFADLSGVAETEARNLSDSLNAVAMLASQAGNLTLPGPDGLASLLFGIASQVDTFASLTYVSASANERLQHPEQYGQGASYG